VPVYYVSKLARDTGVTVCQLGEGSDELFFGYPGWRLMLRLQALNDLPVPKFLKRAGLAGLRATGRGRGMPYEWLRRGSLGQPVFWGGAEGFSDSGKRALLSPRLRQQFRGLSSWDALAPIHSRFKAAAWEQSDFNWMSYLDLNLRLPELLLMRVDKMSMGVGLEARVPFLDHRLVNFAMSVPTIAKTGRKSLKYLLKRSVRGIIPDAIIDRPKQGFGVPVYEWFLGRLGEMARSELGSFCACTDFLDPTVVKALLRSGNAALIWYTLNFALWWRQFIADSPRTH
jgi:asparagine synthase (glutamine-hydrolysing)